MTEEEKALCILAGERVVKCSCGSEVKVKLEGAMACEGCRRWYFLDEFGELTGPTKRYFKKIYGPGVKV
jgi:hypothetical protein